MIATFGIAKLVSSTDGLGDAGVFFLSTTVISIVGTSTAFGTQIGLVYFMPRVREEETPDPRGLIKVALGPVALASGLSAIAVFRARRHHGRPVRRRPVR